MSRAAFLFALTAPAMREKNLESLWAQVFTQSGLFSEKSLQENEPVAIAEARSNENLAVTTVMVANDNQDAQPLHVVWNKACGQLIVTGEGKLSSELEHAFRLSGSVYIDRNDEHAAEKAKEAIGDFIGDNARQESLLKTAFLLRAGMTDQAAEQENSLADLLVSRKVKPILPVYITNKPAAPAA